MFFVINGFGLLRKWGRRIKTERKGKIYLLSISYGIAKV